MMTPLGGPSQVIVKCRNHHDYDGFDIEPGDAVSVINTSYDTETGEPVIWVESTTYLNKDRFIGIALNRSSKGAAGSTGTSGSLEPTGGSHERGYLNVCTFGLVQAKVAINGLALVTAGDIVFAQATNAGAAAGWAASTAAARGILVHNAAGSGTNAVTAGIAVATGGWGTSGGSPLGEDNAMQVLTWVFINGIGRQGFGGT